MTAPVKLTIELTGELADDMREIALREERHVKVQARKLLVEAIRQAKGAQRRDVTESLHPPQLHR
jgi:hypothetical protein